MNRTKEIIVVCISAIYFAYILIFAAIETQILAYYGIDDKVINPGQENEKICKLQKLLALLCESNYIFCIGVLTYIFSNLSCLFIFTFMINMVTIYVFIDYNTKNTVCDNYYADNYPKVYNIFFVEVVNCLLLIPFYVVVLKFKKLNRIIINDENEIEIQHQQYI